MNTVTTATRTLSELEGIVERGLETFVEVGRALLEIRSGRLYRTTHETWEGYCKERWGWSRISANRHIAAAEVVEMIPTGITPQSERVARELTPLAGEPGQVRDAWDSILQKHGPEPTATEVRAVVGTISGRNGKMRRVPWQEPGKTMDNLVFSFGNYAERLTEVVSQVQRDDPRAADWIKGLQATQRAIGAALRLLERARDDARTGAA